MKKLAIALFLVAIAPAHLMALNTSELLSTIAMPLAVAAVSNLSNVPQDSLATLVSTLNQANVPPTQFVQVIRYVPVALMDQNGQPFIAYVQQQTTQGVTGNALVDAIAQQLQSSYGVTPQMVVTEPATTFVVSDNYIPQDVYTRLGLGTISTDPLSMIALPLAVAAVSNISGVPQDQLANLVATLNQANVPAVQEVQIIRYVPVALVTDNGVPFVQFVQQQVSQGVVGAALVPVVTQQLQTYYPSQIVLNTPPPQPAVVEQNFVPAMVTSRVEEVRVHPHGGPPGLIKKQLGLQTGAEVVHGEKPGRQFTPAPVAVVPEPKQHGRGRGHAAEVPMSSAAPQPAQPRVEEHGHGRGHEVVAAPPLVVAPAPVAAPAAAPPQGKGKEGGPPGQEKPKGGKGHGKD